MVLTNLKSEDQARIVAIEGDGVSDSNCCCAVYRRGALSGWSLPMVALWFLRLMGG